MTRISFYILKGSQEHDRQVFACRLIEKAYLQGNHVYVHAADEQQAEQLNTVLWSFRPDSFVPHELMNETPDTNCPILIGHNAAPPRLMNLLINLSPQQPLFFSQFERMAEFINDDEHIKNSGRERYRFYQQRGYDLESHSI
jgi:DNA polymerase III subunit chi